MQYKQVSVAGDLTVPVPLGLTAEEEAKYIASRVACVDLEQLKTDSAEILKAWEEGKMMPMEVVARELKTSGEDASTLIELSCPGEHLGVVGTAIEQSQQFPG